MAETLDDETRIAAQLNAIENRLRATLHAYAGPPSRPHRRVVADTLMLVDFVRRAPRDVDVRAVAMIAGVLETARDIRQARAMERALRLRIDMGARLMRTVLIAGGVSGGALIACVIAILVAAYTADGHLLGLNPPIWPGVALGILASATAGMLLNIRNRLDAGTDALLPIVVYLLSGLALSIAASLGLVFLFHFIDVIQYVKAFIADFWKAIAGLALKAGADQIRSGSSDAAFGFLCALIGGLFSRSVLSLIVALFTSQFIGRRNRKEKPGNVSLDSP